MGQTQNKLSRGAKLRTEQTRPKKQTNQQNTFLFPVWGSFSCGPVFVPVYLHTHNCITGAQTLASARLSWSQKHTGLFFFLNANPQPREKHSTGQASNSGSGEGLVSADPILHLCGPGTPYSQAVPDPVNTSLHVQAGFCYVYFDFSYISNSM